MQTAGELLTAEEVAQRLRVKVPRIYELCRRGELSHLRVGRQIRIDWDLALQELLREAEALGRGRGPSDDGRSRAQRKSTAEFFGL